jgi:uncharacterized protein YciW
MLRLTRWARRRGERGRHCGLGSGVEAPDGCEVASNRLASITKFATMLTTDPEWRQQARAGDWCERDLHFAGLQKDI